MTVYYNLAPQPKWREYYPSTYGSPIAGTPLVGGKIYTYESSSHVTPKATYTSNQGSPPAANTNPIILDANGEATIYWELDDTAPNDLYYIEVRDPNGVLIYARDDFDGAPLTTTTPSTTKNDNNFIRNPQFTWNRFKATSNLRFENATLYAGCYVCDDWIFTKSNTNATENVQIIPFTLGQTSVPNAPINYLSWNVTTGGSGETFKNIYQRYKKVASFGSNSAILTQMAFQIYARSASSSTLTVTLRHYFGSGGSPSADVTTVIGTFNLTSTWNLYTGVVTLPNLNGKSLGTNGDDAVQLELGLPLNAGAAANIDVANIQFESGNVVNSFQYQTPDEQKLGLEKDWFTAPTGDIKFAAGATTGYPGWLKMNDGTLSNVTGAGTLYAHEDVYGLYSYLWSNFADAQCPVSTGRGASALADFDANKTIRLPLTMARLMGNAGAGATLTNRVNGVDGGAETSKELLTHTHLYDPPSTVQAWEGPGPGIVVVGTTAAVNTGGPTSLPAGGSVVNAQNIMNPFTFINAFIKL